MIAKGTLKVETGASWSWQLTGLILCSTLPELAFKITKHIFLLAVVSSVLIAAIGLGATEVFDTCCFLVFAVLLGDDAVVAQPAKIRLAIAKDSRFIENPFTSYLARCNSVTTHRRAKHAK